MKEFFFFPVNGDLRFVFFVRNGPRGSRSRLDIFHLGFRGGWGLGGCWLGLRLFVA
jgi:hypothetical protein